MGSDESKQTRDKRAKQTTGKQIRPLGRRQKHTVARDDDDDDMRWRREKTHPRLESKLAS
jgi:hypothetical protein